MRIPMLTLLLLGACASVLPPEPPPKLKSETEQYGVYNIHTLYWGRQPELDDLAIALVFTPGGARGVGVIGRVTNLETKADYMVPLDIDVLELAPGRYRFELYFWIGRSSFKETGAGERGVKLESLRSADIAVREATLVAGGTYYIGAEMKLKGTIADAEKDRFHPLRYGASMEEVKDAPPVETEASEWMWRPRVTKMKPDKAGKHRAYRK